MERSASRLLGRVFSRVISEAMCIEWCRGRPSLCTTKARRQKGYLGSKNGAAPDYVRLPPILASQLPFGAELRDDFRFLFHCDSHRDGDIPVQTDRHLIVSDALDRFVELDLALIDLDLVRAQRIGNVEGGDRAI
jgi:hypothetical protein